MRQNVILSDNLEKSLEEAISRCSHDRIFILADETTAKCCLPRISSFPALESAETIVIGATDMNKSLESLAHVWTELSQRMGSRKSLMICLGGGMVTDLGGFAASTFKRGISYINIPTTLLSMVDASVGGKTGINFNGLKNEIGVFSPASSVIIDTGFLSTLDRENLLSGYAEMLKHGLISDESHWTELAGFDIENPDLGKLQELVARSVAVKEDIVEKDPLEKGIRKALNLGHTIGHAFESYAMRTGHPALHGYAVAWGLIPELYLSVAKAGLKESVLYEAVSFIKEHYGRMMVTCKDYDALYELMRHDKKNQDGIINFTLLSGIGQIMINQTAGKEEIYEALDFYREC